MERTSTLRRGRPLLRASARGSARSRRRRDLRVVDNPAPVESTDPNHPRYCPGKRRGPPPQRRRPNRQIHAKIDASLPDFSGNSGLSSHDRRALRHAESTSDAKLTLRVARRVAPVAACADVADSNASDGTYRATASSFDGRHLTVRFHHAAGDDPSAADAALFPSDVSLDADLDTAPVTAHMQLMDADWDDVLDVTASRDR